MSRVFLFPQLWVLESTGASPEAESLSPLGYSFLCFCLGPCASQIIHLTLLFSLHTPEMFDVKLI